VSITPQQFNNFFVDSVSNIKQQINFNRPYANDRPGSGLSVNHNPVSFRFSTVTPECVLRAVSRLKNSNSMDFYNMSNNLLKEIISGILHPFTFCINLCLVNGFFPEELKISRVCPVYKKGDRDRPESYRPISVIPTLSKVIELIVFDQVSNFLETNNLLSLSQYGFRRGKSTLDAIDDLVQAILKTFETRGFAWATLCDLSKAFDCVSHDGVFSRLEYCGVSGVAHAFFVSYLKNRKQRVLLDGTWSDEVTLQFGVPQGSVLGPLLFLLAIDDLPNSISGFSKTILYADDTTLISVSENVDELKQLAGNALQEASVWFQKNGFLLNNDKTHNIIFSLRPVDQANNEKFVKFLGVYLDSHLNWDHHIDHLSVRLSRVIYLIRRLKNVVNSNYIKMAYFAFFQSIFRYFFRANILGQ